MIFDFMYSLIFYFMNCDIMCSLNFLFYELWYYAFTYILFYILYFYVLYFIWWMLIYVLYFVLWIMTRYVIFWFLSYNFQVSRALSEHFNFSIRTKYVNTYYQSCQQWHPKLCDLIDLFFIWNLHKSSFISTILSIEIILHKWRIILVKKASQKNYAKYP